MPSIIAFQLAVVVWVSVGILVFNKKLYYIGFCVFILLAAGASGLEYAPFLWVPAEFVFTIRDIFNGRSHISKSN